MDTQKMISLFLRLLESPATKKTFTQIAMGRHDKDITLCSGWRIIHYKDNEGEFQITLEVIADGVLYINDRQNQTVLSAEDTNRLLRKFHDVAERKYTVEEIERKILGIDKVVFG